MIHSLEHFPEPLIALKQIANLCRGGLFIQVCNIDENPFDILIADHLMHFSPDTLRLLVKRAGFEAGSVATDWVPKEISLLAQVKAGNGRDQAGADCPDVEAIYEKMTACVQWLHDLRQAGLEAAQNDKPFGLFGTSIAATWLAPQLQERVSFFVDEDPSRIGKLHLGQPVLQPKDIPDGAVVFLSMAPRIAAAIAGRLRSLACKLVLPPAL